MSLFNCIHIINRIFTYQLLLKMRATFRSFSDLCFTNHVQKSRLFSIHKEKSTSNRKLDLLLCGISNRQSYNTPILFTPVATISYSCLTLYVSYLTAKFTLRFGNEMVNFIFLTAQRFKYSWYDRIQSISGLPSKVSAFFSHPEPSKVATDTFCITNITQEKTNTSTLPIIKYENATPINSLFYKHIPSITGRLLTFNKPKVVQHISTHFLFTHSKVHNLSTDPRNIPPSFCPNIPRNITPTLNQTPPQTCNTAPNPTSKSMDSVVSTVETSVKETRGQVKFLENRKDENSSRYNLALFYYKVESAGKYKAKALELFRLGAQKGHAKSAEIAARVDKFTSEYPDILNL